MSENIESNSSTLAKYRVIPEMLAGTTTVHGLEDGSTCATRNANDRDGQDGGAPITHPHTAQHLSNPPAASVTLPGQHAEEGPTVKASGSFWRIRSLKSSMRAAPALPMIVTAELKTADQLGTFISFSFFSASSLPSLPSHM